MTELREYEARARSTGTFGRVLAGCREHEVLLDGPVWNGCLGEEITPGELFLAAVASCGVELIEVIARQREISVASIDATITGVLDRANPVRTDRAVFNSVELRFDLHGIDDASGRELVAGFQQRCPLYGTVETAVPQVTVNVTCHAV